MFVLGITGLYCSGKSIAGKLFIENGFVEIDVDKLGHSALNIKKEEIIQYFGQDICENGEISRPRLGKLVFSSDTALEALENMVHPVMVEQTKTLLTEYKKEQAAYVSINAAILYKMGLDKLCDAVMAIVSPDEIIIQRGIARDGLQPDDIKRRLKKQKLYNENFKSAEYFIVNNDNFNEFMNELNAVLKKIKGE